MQIIRWTVSDRLEGAEGKLRNIDLTTYECSISIPHKYTYDKNERILSFTLFV